MKYSEISKLDNVALHNKMIDIKKTMFSLRFKKSTGKLENPVTLRFLRKDFARCMTLLNENIKNKT